MNKLALTAAAAVLTAASPAVAQTFLDATFTGTATTNIPTPIPGQQTFTLNGVFTTFVASPNLPQINGGDIARYQFTITGTSADYNAATQTTTYTNLAGLIFYDLNGNNSYDANSDPLVQGLTSPSLTATFGPGFAAAALLGSLYSTGPVQFAGNTIDLRPINGAAVTGTYTSNAPQNGTVTGAITFPNPAFLAVPEPATWGMMVLGFGLVGAGLRGRRTRATVRFA